MDCLDYRRNWFFFFVSAAVPEIATLGVDIVKITWEMTLMLMLISDNFVIFGSASKNYEKNGL